ncbi:MAG: molybdenum ABC transporter ATP-binding protein [Sulfuricellaceae bacterium]|jgi:molybdate transport system ATP-binding protein
MNADRNLIHARFRVNYGGFSLDVDLELPGQGVTALFGHSGSGKTTLLRCIAGLERAKNGYLALNGDVWQNDQGFFLPTYRRPLGYVFQEASLFPHLNVRQNLDFGLRRVPREERQVQTDHVIELLGIGHLLPRRPDTLSGGERQRVGIARALFTSPRLLLMDEPLAALDAPRKAEILPYLERLHRELSIPVLYVSHSPDEVARLADTLVLMENGRATAAGPVAEVMARLDLSTAHGGDAGVVVDTTVGEHDDAYHLTRLDFPGGALWVPNHREALGTPVRARILAKDVSLALVRPEQTSILNILPAEVVETAAESTGRTLARLSLGGTPLLAQVSDKSAALLGLAPGKRLFVQIKAVSVL